MAVSFRSILLVPSLALSTAVSFDSITATLVMVITSLCPLMVVVCSLQIAKVQKSHYTLTIISAE